MSQGTKLTKRSFCSFRQLRRLLRTRKMPKDLRSVSWVFFHVIIIKTNKTMTKYQFLLKKKKKENWAFLSKITDYRPTILNGWSIMSFTARIARWVIPNSRAIFMLHEVPFTELYSLWNRLTQVAFQNCGTHNSKKSSNFVVEIDSQLTRLAPAIIFNHRSRLADTNP